jgi:hypothetical protein
MKKILYLLIVLNLIYMYSCRDTIIDDKNITKILIDNNSVEESMDISDLIEEINIVQLKEQSGSFIGGVFKLFYKDSMYIVFDRVQSKKITLFNKDGDFIKTVLEVGEGPHEALQISDCWINYKGELEAYDYVLNKLFQFDTTFTLKNIVKIPERYIMNSVYRIPKTENYIGYAGFGQRNKPKDGSLYHIAFLDKKLAITKTTNLYDKKYQGIEWRELYNHFIPFNDTLRFIQSMDNYIYTVNNSSLRKRYKVEYKSHSLPDNFAEETIRENYSLLKKRSETRKDLESKAALYKDYVFFDGTWLEGDRYLVIGSRGRDKYRFYSFIDKQNSQEIFSAKSLHETKRYKLQLFPFVYFDNPSNSYIGVVFGDQIKELLYNDSNFHNELTFNPGSYYIMTVKLKK